MKKIIVCIIALCLSAPAAAGWKDDFLNEMSALMQDLGKATKAQGIESSQLNLNYGVFNGLSGFCVGFAEKSGFPIPQNITDEIVRVHKIFLRGKSPKTQTLHNIGKLCLDYAEGALRRQGISDADIEVAGKAITKVFLPRMRAAMGLSPRQ